MEKEKLRLKRPMTKKKQLEQDLAHVSQEMYKRNLELAQTNQMLSLLRKIDSLVLESHETLDVLCQQMASAITDKSNYALVAFLTNSSHHNSLELVGLATSSGKPPETKRLHIDLDKHNQWLSSQTRMMTISARSITTDDLSDLTGLSSNEITALRHELPVQSVVIIKLMARHRLVGLMVVGLTQEKHDINEKENTLLERLSEAVGIAIDNRLLFEENQRVLKQLQRTNEKLKALDETKDEFISMASHQLRTPLTSVKGYLSMVIEGDSGKITASQHKLLDQAFISSQRMVYLIADLLNVSRLRTGKFIIEAVPTNLAEAVQGEVEQLEETAAGRKLELKYEKPKDFPMLMLDETKIRQVIMNFVDNAIYYTPAGGHINIEVKDLPTSVEFTVMDDGLGVPKHEQHHLFTKFFRAGNAKQARPDGTGLGLFMAKKVIVAQGGSLIFKSEEGKGSTFGFSFAKSKLKSLPPTKETSKT